MRKQAELAGISQAAFLRRLILGREIKPKPPEEYAALLRELSAIGNNINQLAKLANTRKTARPGQMEEAVRLVREAWRLVKDTL